MTVRSALAVRPPRPMTLPRSSGCTRTSRTRPRRKPRLPTWTSSGCSTMPLTRCSRASSSILGSIAFRLGARLSLGGYLSGRFLGRSFGVSVGLSISLGLSVGVGLSVSVGLSVGVSLSSSVGLSVCLGPACSLGPGLSFSCGLSLRRGLSLRLGIGLGLGFLLLSPGRLRALAVLGLTARLGVHRLGLRLCLRAAVGQRLGNSGRKCFLLVGFLPSDAQGALGARQALELLPVAGNLQDLAHWISGLCADGQPMLRALRVNLDERRLCLRVVLADLLDRAPVPLGTGVGNNDPVVRRTDLAQALQLDLYSHGCGLLPADWFRQVAFG